MLQCLTVQIIMELYTGKLHHDNCRINYRHMLGHVHACEAQAELSDAQHLCLARTTYA